MTAPRYSHSALRQYQGSSLAGAADYASPHKLIDMLLGGAIDRIARARGHLLRSEIPQKLEVLTSVVAILDHLRLSLDYDAGGDIARNLGMLYGYMLQRVALANATGDARVLDEISDLLRKVKSAWEALPQATLAVH